MLAAKAVSQFKRDGYFVIPGVIDAVLKKSSARAGGIVDLTQIGSFHRTL
jgi:hypothetical protein